MLASGTRPPSGVNESCQPLIAPQLASVVTVAKSAVLAMPNRTSFPSMLPPGDMRRRRLVGAGRGQHRVAARFRPVGDA